ncbi:HDR166Cp [Eremothecium sinecaudum]|uniref:HDR166Cp n=1 Tax=Eremothecium sinecaudum TaxID=45286 RepID=A0A109UZ65_9SACH|nr:HDR166Cp [Eremothecium sinecaudum]AMD20908.1 HDR166Cp [Eremothecium sinecaudum]
MGCTASTHMMEDENDSFLQDARANDVIEQNLLMEKQRGKNEIKLLLLGAGESGKSTVLKQLKLLHQGGFTHEERLQYGQVIWTDAIQSMKILIIQARKLGIPLDCDDPEKNRLLFECKRVVLQSKALDHIDASVAGGPEFLNDYVLKYSERSENKRRVQSTGRVEAFEADLTGSHPTRGIDMQEVSMGLSEQSGNENDTGMFVKPGAAALHSSPKNLSNEQIAYAIRQLWDNDRGIRQCFARSNEFQLEGSAAYYFDNIEHFAQPSYSCTDEDILRGRIKTTGITETQFTVGSSKFKVLDAGGQRSERRKWIHCFQGITAVLFVLAVSEYDQMLFEDERVNRMHEAIMLFDTLLNSKWFYNTPFILFLNKVDIFEEKIKRSPIRQHFPDYPGRVGDAEAGLKYFERIFLSLNRSKKPIYVHRTCATDTKSMKFVLSAVTDLIVQQNLKKSGIL